MPDEMPRFLIVDGHSMIFAWDDLAILHGQSRAAAREELIRRVTLLQDMGTERVVLVFDGKGEKVESEAEKDGIQIFYSQSGMTADAVIERLAAKYAGKYRMTVASRDRAVLDGASAAGADVISANGLLDRLRIAEGNLRSELKKRSERR